MPEPKPDYHHSNQVAVPATPTPNRPVTFRRHPIDWGTSSDLDAITSQRAMAFEPFINEGCWYLNPEYTVRSLAPNAEFFAKVLKTQSSWLQSTLQVMSKFGQRQEARKTEQGGRLAAFLGLTPGPSAGQFPEAPPKTIPLGSLSTEQRREVIRAGQLAKQLAFGGVLFINGELIEPPTWNRLADELLTQVKVIPRSVDLSALKASDDTSTLEQLTREAIQEHLATVPAHVAYITPRKTISAPIPSESFLDKATRHQKEWDRMLRRTMGSSNHRLARPSSDIKALTLFYDGTLVHDGQFYRPDFDREPGQPPDSGFPGTFPGHLTPVSDQDLDLRPAVPIGVPEYSHPILSVTIGSAVGLSGNLNDEFMDLFDANGH